ncbi:glycoside hydrolase family 88 protein [Latilactobacillus sakei]|uniref:Glycoside hydrolase family 88 protein n=1 Tax=Latilactobacillus sakei TaxID=1599 RepID=A0AAF0GUC5_LATSK|nr:glycoside hydrolase family 88 protein [Latilactobacillus sakei]WGI19992.1 glycoside hydrolase family 88 protein [Latilactobacillus sakei]
MDNQQWATQVLSKIELKVDQELQRLGDQIPYMAVDGRYTDMGVKDTTWWTNGFWSGILWQLYHATGKPIYKETAQKNEERLDQAFLDFKGLHHDVGFMWLHTAVANYRLTQNPKSLQRGLHAAELLAGRYNPRGQFIRSWNRDRAGWVIIDSMLNIPLLYWAQEALDDPRFGFIAEDHADKVMNNIVRADGSVAHIGVFDPQDGTLLETLGGQGYGVGSSWSRGQAWAIYGFALSYRHTHKAAYLDTAKKVANYFIANIQKTGYIPVSDFRAPQTPVKVDTSAATCAACGFLEIARHVPENERPLYEEAAVNILKAIVEKHVDWRTETDGIVLDATPAYHEEETVQTPIIYSDYYFIEAILRLLNQNFLIW